MKTFKPLKKKLKLSWKNFVMLTVSGIINAFGVTLLLAPLELIDGALSGTSMLLWTLTRQYGMTLAMYLAILNVPFFLIGLKKLGLEFTVYSLYAIAIYSLASLAFERLVLDQLPIGAGSPIAGNDMLLCAIFGGLISGIGSGLTIRFGGALDGIEVMAVTFAKKIGISVGTFVMSYNAILYIVAGLITSSWQIPLYSMIAYAVGLKAVDFIVEGFDKAKAAMIITENKDDVAAALSGTFGRGLTVWNASGYFSGNEKSILYCVVNRFQIGKLKSVVLEQDPAAFVTITDITDSLATGLKLGDLRKKKKDDKKKNLPTVENEMNDKELLTESTPQDNASVLECVDTHECSDQNDSGALKK